VETNTIINILLFVLIGWFFYKRVGPVKGLKNLSGEELNQKVRNGDTMLVDVREHHEFMNGHIPKSINIPLSKLKNQLAEIPKDKELILYCQSGMRSKHAARILQKQNYKKVSHLSGGIASWSKSQKRGNG
jgi:rhodanese-related sulfurtransferase